MCSAKKRSAEQGKLCDAIERQCVEASKCCRKMDVSTSVATWVTLKMSSKMLFDPFAADLAVIHRVHVCFCVVGI